jgi:DNA-binding NarL/FixJ family response regulator
VTLPKVLLADDHKMVAEGLKSLLSDDFDLIGIVEDGRALIAAARTLKPDVIVVDVSMPNLNGIDAIPLLRKQDAHVKIVILTMHHDPAYAHRALAAGAKGFVLKHSAADELALAINAALKGHTFITPALTGAVLRGARNGSGTKEKAERNLIPRQREILQLVTEGHSAKEIAVALAISPRTVEFHKYQIMELHNIHSTAGLIHFAIKNGIVGY